MILVLSLFDLLISLHLPFLDDSAHVSMPKLAYPALQRPQQSSTSIPLYIGQHNNIMKLRNHHVSHGTSTALMQRLVMCTRIKPFPDSLPSCHQGLLLPRSGPRVRCVQDIPHSTPTWLCLASPFTGAPTAAPESLWKENL